MRATAKWNNGMTIWRLDGSGFGQLFHLWIVLMLVDNGLGQPAKVGGPAATLCVPGYTTLQMWAGYTARISLAIWKYLFTRWVSHCSLSVVHPEMCVGPIRQLFCAQCRCERMYCAVQGSFSSKPFLGLGCGGENRVQKSSNKFCKKSGETNLTGGKFLTTASLKIPI